MNLSYKEALARAMNICSKSEKSVSDIRQALSRWGLTDIDKQEKIIDYLKDNNFIDESRYSNSYVRDKHKFNSWGKVKLRAMLRSKGIAESTIDKAINSISQELYLDTLKNDIISKRNSVKAKNQYELRAKLMRFAQSRGYETDLIYKTLDEILKS